MLVFCVIVPRCTVALYIDHSLFHSPYLSLSLVRALSNVPRDSLQTRQ